MAEMGSGFASAIGLKAVTSVKSLCDLSTHCAERGLSRVTLQPVYVLTKMMSCACKPKGSPGIYVASEHKQDITFATPSFPGLVASRPLAGLRTFFYLGPSSLRQ